MADGALKAALKNGEMIVAPGIYDLISGLIADNMGFKALYVTGYGTVASYLGLPDAGLATYTDMLTRVAQIAEKTKTPIIADADTGYGGLLNIRHTVRGYEHAGVTAIQFEDQVSPKKCGHTPYREVVSIDEMTRKIQVACDSRSSDDFLIVARTDARTGYGIDEAIKRGQAYAAAGADVIFIESPETEEELKLIGERIDAPLLANMVNGGKTPMLPAAKLAELGYQIAIFPAAGFLSAGAALEAAYGELRNHGTSTGETAMYDFPAFTRMLGFEDIWEFERKYLVNAAEN
ncbi:isocitrate lyase/PEP mutase family protein [Sphingobium sp. H39-3-25]|uniref:isocitrate lyase/PEP mutase family protein n=1 Tax=Sphingobium arseniciresistens TaxID=3030834 RepID=UPI0023B89BB8|nr:isocitrate lyase/PEP mutase family protein [Sphingobium arseniciresistens]